MKFRTSRSAAAERWSRFDAGQLQSQIASGEQLVSSGQKVPTWWWSVRRFRRVHFLVLKFVVELVVNLLVLVVALYNWSGNRFPSVTLDLWWGRRDVHGRVVAEGLLGGEDGLRGAVHGFGGRRRGSVRGLWRWAVDGLWGWCRKRWDAVGWFLGF